MPSCHPALRKCVAFTLAEFFSPHCASFRKTAFTLAEVLITLGIIGVVAAITMPTLLTNVNERVNSHRQANIAFKVTQAMDKMQALGLLNGSYSSTDDFVDELQKHLKIAKRCDASHIADCWPTDKVTTSDGEKFEVKNAVLGRDLRIKHNTSNNVGLILADGAAIILTYNQDATPVDEATSIVANKKSLPVGFGKFEDLAYTSSSTASIDFVMDVNGAKGPNSEVINGKYYDIRSFKTARFGDGCTARVPGIGCIIDLGTSYECIDTTKPENKKYDSNVWSVNCWAGANKACIDLGLSLPDLATLQKIHTKTTQYPVLNTKGHKWTTNEQNYFGAYTYAYYGGGGSWSRRNDKSISVVCVGD